MALALKLFQDEIENPFIRENFARIELFMKRDLLERGSFVFHEIVFSSAVTNVAIPHGLTFVPKDVLQLSVHAVHTATVSWLYDNFTESNVYVTTSAACTVRCLIGRYRNKV